jgi:hypothetical protein
MADVTFENLVSQQCWDRKWRKCTGYISSEIKGGMFYSLNLTIHPYSCLILQAYEQTAANLTVMVVYAHLFVEIN